MRSGSVNNVCLDKTSCIFLLNRFSCFQALLTGLSSQLCPLRTFQTERNDLISSERFYLWTLVIIYADTRERNSPGKKD